MTAPKEITDLISTSGNTFHAKVARWFSQQGWHVEISPYYMDQTQGKAREIDLVAEKIVADIQDFPSALKGQVAIRLFIECKFVATDSVFWFADKDRISAKNLVCKSGGFRENNSYTDQHHYLTKNRVAKLFASTNNKNSENEPFYKALNQALNGMVSMLGRSLAIPKVHKSRLPIEVLEFPVVVCSSFARLYEMDFFADSEPQPITENFQLEVRYAYADRSGNPRNDYFLLDFVAMEKLGEFVKSIEKDGDLSAYLSSN